MARGALNRLLIMEILRVHRLGIFHVFLYFALQDSLPDCGFPDLGAQVGAVGNLLRQNIGSALDGLLDIFHAFFRIDIRGGCLLNPAAHLLGKDLLSQSVQPLLPGDRRPGPAFGFIRAVQVFQLHKRADQSDLPSQLIGQLPLLLNRFQDSLLPFFQRTEVAQSLIQHAQLFIIQRPVSFLAVAGNEGNGIPVIDQLHHCLDLPLLYGELFCDHFTDIHNTYPCSSVRPPYTQAKPFFLYSVFRKMQRLLSD